MKTQGTYDRLVKKTKWFIAQALSELNDEKKGAVQAMAKPEILWHRLSWNADDWARSSQMLIIGRYIAAELEKALLENLSLLLTPTQLTSFFSVTLDECARNIQIRLAQEALRKIFRGPSHSSNPLTVVMEGVEIQAYKKAMEYLCDLDEYVFAQSNTIKAVYAARDAEEAKRETEEKMIARSLKFWKQGGTYIGATFNSIGDALERRNLDVNTKPAANRIAEAWAKEIQETQRHIPVSVLYINTGIPKFES